MRKVLAYLKARFKNFFINPFWKSWVIDLLILASILINGVIWYFYIVKIQRAIGSTAMFYSSGVIVLNAILANLTFRREKLASFILISTALLIQILILIFMRISVFVGRL